MPWLAVCLVGRLADEVSGPSVARSASGPLTGKYFWLTEDTEIINIIILVKKLIHSLASPDQPLKAVAIAPQTTQRVQHPSTGAALSSFFIN